MYISHKSGRVYIYILKFYGSNIDMYKSRVCTLDLYMDLFEIQKDPDIYNILEIVTISTIGIKYGDVR
jgi:hypothetical protein